MAIAKIRRALNDSSIGRKINSSDLGILVEAASLKLSDIIWDIRYDIAELRWRQIERAVNALPYEQRDWSKVDYPMKKVGEKWEASCIEDHPEFAYSWTTQFYTRAKDGKMSRVPTVYILRERFG